MAQDPVTWSDTLYSAAIWLWLGWLAMGTPVGLLLLVWGLYGRRGKAGVPTCPECGQDMRGLLTLACPTCSYQPDAESEWFRPRRRSWALWLAALLLLPWLYPAFGVGMQLWDRANYYRIGWPTQAISFTPQALPLVLDRTPAWVHPAWDRLTVIHLSTHMPLDEEFQQLAFLTALRVLRIDAAQRLTDTAFDAFEDKTSLTDVELHHSQITDKAVRLLESSNGLTHLALPGSSINGSALQYLRHAPLQQINLANTNFSSGAMRFLGDMPGLTHLNLTAARIADNGLPALRPLPALQVLILDGCPLTDAAAPELARHQHLHTLSVQGTEISEAAAVQLFERIPTLQQIRLTGQALQRPTVVPGG